MPPAMMCNPNNTLCDVLGNYGATPHGFLDSIRGTGFLETPTNGLYHNNTLQYYGTMGEMGMPYDVHMGSGVSTSAAAAAAVKQEMCSNGRDEEGDDNRVLWGFPWQHGGEGNMNMVNDVDSSRQNSCNIGFGSSWHGLVNSPLM